jgi:hypothetical protein
MSGDALKAKAQSLQISLGGHHAAIQNLIVSGVLDSPVSSEHVAERVVETSGVKLKTIHVQTYMKKFMSSGIVHAVKPHGSRQNFWVLCSVSRSDALKLIGKTKKVQDAEHELFSAELESKLHKGFRKELDELRDNFGKNGNCTAFLLRKILEKLVIIVLSKNGRGQLLEDKNRPGGWMGLKGMLEVAAKEQINGVPFLVPKTANEIKGMKFLGDTAAHNPLTGVDTPSILPQMPFLITAYKELAERL